MSWYVAHCPCGLWLCVPVPAPVQVVRKTFIKQTNNLSFAQQATCIAPMLRGLLAGADGPADIQRWCELASCYLEVSPFARVLGYSRSCPSTVAASF